jgi:hypothetical protein
MGCCFDKKELIEIRFPKSSLFFLTEATHSDLLTCKTLQVASITSLITRERSAMYKLEN